MCAFACVHLYMKADKLPFNWIVNEPTLALLCCTTLQHTKIENDWIDHRTTKHFYRSWQCTQIPWQTTFSLQQIHWLHVFQFQFFCHVVNFKMTFAFSSKIQFARFWFYFFINHLHWWNISKRVCEIERKNNISSSNFFLVDFSLNKNLNV